MTNWGKTEAKISAHSHLDIFTPAKASLASLKSVRLASLSVITMGKCTVS